MSHARQQCLAQIKTLVTGLPLAGARVFQSRYYPFQQAELSGRLVRYAANTETNQTMALGAPRIQDRVARIEVVNVVEAVDNIDAELDDLCLEVERALALPGADGPWNLITLLATAIDFNVEGEKPCGEARMLYEVRYVTEENAPDVAL